MDSVEIARVHFWTNFSLPGPGFDYVEIARCPVVDSVQIATAQLWTQLRLGLVSAGAKLRLPGAGMTRGLLVVDQIWDCQGQLWTQLKLPGPSCGPHLKSPGPGCGLPGPGAC